MPALELIAGQTTDPGAVYTALTSLLGNSFTLRSSREGEPVYLIQAMNHATDAVTDPAVFSRIRSPLMHDNVVGITVAQLLLTDAVSPSQGLLNPIPRQKLVPQDTLTHEVSVSVAAGGIVHGGLLIYYADLPGVDAVFITPEELRTRALNYVTVENTITALATGEWGTAEAINAETDLLKANTLYALMGYFSPVRGAMVRYRASAWGNLGIGGPLANAGVIDTIRWFTDLSIQADIPLIPVFNSADDANILIDICTDAAGADVKLFTHLAQLSP
ncbi:hypothetical protein ES705_16984 [subsurface metagenome]